MLMISLVYLIVRLLNRPDIKAARDGGGTEVAVLTHSLAASQIQCRLVLERQHPQQIRPQFRSTRTSRFPEFPASEFIVPSSRR